ncbi:hypothetical protein L6452_09471 [Arctium lappa]|uniref:Uncharacterized protein n=1 Tax=Arctium lappa TaxID=4217 RepID=A0ACB9DK53_ARCLA|nr:hypothetical protein L6452_09471 [Arctium lappa]
MQDFVHLLAGGAWNTKRTPSFFVHLKGCGGSTTTTFAWLLKLFDNIIVYNPCIIIVFSLELELDIPLLKLTCIWLVFKMYNLCRCFHPYMVWDPIYKGLVSISLGGPNGIPLIDDLCMGGLSKRGAP